MTLKTLLALVLSAASFAASPAAAQPLPAIAPVPPVPAIPPAPASRAVAATPPGSEVDERADDLYERARDLIEEGHFERAVAELDRLIALNSNRTDAAYYWKAYSLARLGQRAESLAAVSELTKRYPNSRWLKDARALEVEVRQSSGQTVWVKHRLCTARKVMLGKR